MSFPKGYGGPGCQYSFQKEVRKAKKDSLKKLKGLASKTSMERIKKHTEKSKDSIDPDYPGFKGGK